MPPAKSSNIYPRSGPVRGLIRIARNVIHNSGRSLIHDWNKQLPREFGTCKWCRQPAPSKRHVWCEKCKEASWAAAGHTWYSNEDLLRWRARGPGSVVCAVCKEEQPHYWEVDHKLSLAVAWEMKRLGMRGWWKAWHRSNLRPLCSECHKLKTAADAALLAKLRKE